MQGANYTHRIGGIVGKCAQHQPVLGDALHPGADIGNQGTKKPDAVSGIFQGCESFSHVKASLLKVLNFTPAPVPAAPPLAPAASAVGPKNQAQTAAKKGGAAKSRTPLWVYKESADTQNGLNGGQGEVNQEQHGSQPHQRVNLLDLAASHSQHHVRQEASTNTVSNGVAEGHHGDG